MKWHIPKPWRILFFLYFFTALVPTILFVGTLETDQSLLLVQYRVWVVSCIFAAHVICFFLLSWVIPFWCASELRYLNPYKSPKEIISSLTLLVWGPVGGAWFYGLIFLLFDPLMNVYEYGRWEWGPIDKMTWIVIVLMVALPLPTFILSGLLRRKLVRTLAHRNVCMTCGYDLRGSPGEACPECGAAVDSAKVGETG